VGHVKVSLQYLFLFKVDGADCYPGSQGVRCVDEIGFLFASSTQRVHGAPNPGGKKVANAENKGALTFGLMVVSCFFGSVIVRFIGIKWTLIVGTMGYPPKEFMAPQIPGARKLQMPRIRAL
jgi:hypothetical protein